MTKNQKQYDTLKSQYQVKGNDYYSQARPEMLQFIPDHVTRVLDVGCSSGGFGALLKAERPEIIVWGIEPNESYCALAADKIDNVICGMYSADVPELEGQHFDCIVFNDVLEHLVSPEEALNASKEYLFDQGLVIASIPNILYFPAIYSVLKNQDWKYEESGIFDNTHLRFFTKKSIVRLFVEAGFTIEQIKGIKEWNFWKFNLLNFLLLNRLNDFKFSQFGVIAKKSSV